MKKCIMFLSMLALLLFIGSCGKDEPASYLSKGDITITTSVSEARYMHIWGQDEELRLTYSFTSPRAGFKVNNADVYFGDKLIESFSNTSSFKINVPLSGFSKGRVLLKIEAKCSASGYNETKCELSEYFWITDSKPKSEVKMTCPGSMSNGQQLTARVSFNTNVKEAVFSSVELYWDDERVATATSSEVTYKIEGQTAGVHHVKAKVNWSIPNFATMSDESDEQTVIIR